MDQDIKDSIESGESALISFEKLLDEFDSIIDHLMKGGREKKALAKWLRRNVRRFMSIKDIEMNNPDFMGLKVLSHLVLQYMLLDVENISGISDEKIVRIPSYWFYLESRRWRINLEDGHGDRGKLRVLIDASERVFKKIRDITPEELLSDIDIFLDAWSRTADRVAELMEQKDLNRDERIELARGLSDLGSGAEAIEVLEGIDGWQDDSDVLSEMALVSIDSGDVRRAEAYIDRIPDEHPEKRYVMGEYYIKKNQPGRAYEEFRDYVRHGEERHRKKAKRRIKELETLAEPNASRRGYDSDLYLEIDALYSKALDEIMSGSLEKAEEYLREAKSLLPDNPQVGAQLGLVLILQGRFDEARKVLIDVVNHHPDYLPARRNLMEIDEIEAQYARDPEYLDRLRQNLVAGKFSKKGSS